MIEKPKFLICSDLQSEAELTEIERDDITLGDVIPDALFLMRLYVGQ